MRLSTKNGVICLAAGQLSLSGQGPVKNKNKSVPTMLRIKEYIIVPHSKASISIIKEISNKESSKPYLRKVTTFSLELFLTAFVLRRFMLTASTRQQQQQHGVQASSDSRKHGPCQQLLSPLHKTVPGKKICSDQS